MRRPAGGPEDGPEGPGNVSRKAVSDPRALSSLFVFRQGFCAACADKLRVSSMITHTYGHDA